jgi:hypothetical protein
VATTLLREVTAVRQFLGDPLEQAPSVRQIVKELEAEYHQLGIESSNRGLTQHIGEVVITTNQHQRRYELGIEADQFYKALGITTIPANATVTGDATSKRVTIETGDDRESSLEFTELNRFGDSWPHLAANRGQLFGSSHDSQAVAVYKTIKPGTGEAIVMEFRPTPNSEQRYLLMYQITDWWDTMLSSTDGADDPLFKLPHPSQRMMIRARVGLNLIQKGIVKWALNDDYNMRRGEVVLNGLKERAERYKKTYEDYLDTLEHGDIVYVDLFSDRL